jgi:hypothetical protein
MSCNFHFYFLLLSETDFVFMEIAALYIIVGHVVNAVPTYIFISLGDK